MSYLKSFLSLGFLDGYRSYIAGAFSLAYGLGVWAGWYGAGQDPMPFLVAGVGLLGLGGKLDKLLAVLKK